MSASRILSIPSFFPSLGSGSVYYRKLHDYVNESGFCFDYTKELKIDSFMSHLPHETIDKVGEVVFNSRENSPIKFKKNGEPSKHNKKVIDSPDFEGPLVVFRGINDKWNDSTKEWIYFITIDSHIVKIGMTITNLKDRYSSYSCGYRKTMKAGSCSTTNFIICELCYAALLLGKKVDIWGMEVEKEIKEIEKYGVKVKIPVSIVRGIEEIITTIYKKITGKIPPLCVQHASNVKI